METNKEEKEIEETNLSNDIKNNDGVTSDENGNFKFCDRIMKMAEAVKKRYPDGTDSLEDIALSFAYFETMGVKFDEDGNMLSADISDVY